MDVTTLDALRRNPELACRLADQANTLNHNIELVSSGWIWIIVDVIRPCFRAHPFHIWIKLDPMPTPVDGGINAQASRFRYGVDEVSKSW
jgi:hypothetical protein